MKDDLPGAATKPLSVADVAKKFGVCMPGDSAEVIKRETVREFLGDEAAAHSDAWISGAFSVISVHGNKPGLTARRLLRRERLAAAFPGLLA